MTSPTRRRFLTSTLGAAGALSLGPSLLSCGWASPPRPRHVLLITVDDLRPQLGCYGHARMQTPHMDALAASGARFSRAYASAPVCGPSRASVLTGLRPRRDRFLAWDCRVEVDAPQATTLPAWFGSQGYRTVSLGKVFHHHTDCQGDWSQVSRRGLAPGVQEPWEGRGYRSPEAIRQLSQGRKGFGPAFEAADVPDDGYPDGILANAAIAELQAAGDEPLFLAVGFGKPHLPFNAPQRYWDLYPADQIDLADNPFKPKGAPLMAMHHWQELRNYVGMPKGQAPMTDDLARQLIHGYYAATSYVDAQVGRVLAALDEQGLARDTAVVLWGDHGWNLGEHSLWCKHSLFETSLHSPLLMRLPGAPEGVVRDELVEFTDLYPTLCSAAGIPCPEHLDGLSLAELAREPGASLDRQAIFARFRNGESVKTDRYRYSRFTDRQGRPMSEMLFDHQADPQENTSIHADPAHAAVLSQLRAQLDQLSG